MYCPFFAWHLKYATYIYTLVIVNATEPDKTNPHRTYSYSCVSLVNHIIIDIINICMNTNAVRRGRVVNIKYGASLRATLTKKNKDTIITEIIPIAIRLLWFAIFLFPLLSHIFTIISYYPLYQIWKPVTLLSHSFLSCMQVSEFVK